MKKYTLEEGSRRQLPWDILKSKKVFLRAHANITIRKDYRDSKDTISGAPGLVEGGALTGLFMSYAQSVALSPDMKHLFGEKNTPMSFRFQSHLVSCLMKSLVVSRADSFHVCVTYVERTHIGPAMSRPESAKTSLEALA